MPSFNHKKRKSTVDDDKDCDDGKDCDCDKHRASISSTTLPEAGIDTDGPDGQSSKRTLKCREIAREVVGQSPYERRKLNMIKNGVDQTTASHLSLYGMILPPQTQTQTQTLYGETITTMATSINDASGNNILPSAPQQQIMAEATEKENKKQKEGRNDENNGQEIFFDCMNISEDDYIKISHHRF